MKFRLLACFLFLLAFLFPALSFSQKKDSAQIEKPFVFDEGAGDWSRDIKSPVYVSRILFYDNLNNDFLRRYASDIHLDSSFHSAIKPYIEEDLKGYKGKNRVDISGILDGEVGYEKKQSEMTRGGAAGIGVKGIYKSKISFSYAYMAGDASFPNHLDTSIHYSGVVPGMGRAYGPGPSYSFQHHFGYISYSPNKIFNFQVGKDKHFWGDGYRSLFLSDVSNSFPFLKITTSVWKLKYVNLFAMMKDITASPFKSDAKNKYGSFHYLSWNASKRLNLSLFESIIWQGTDSASHRVRNFDVNYLNPVIFYRPAEYSLGSSDNAFLGGAFKIKVGEKMQHQFYGQVMLDEFLLKEVLAIFKKLAHPFDHTILYGWWGNKQGVQLGYQCFDLFSLRGLSLQTEINIVRPFTYSHGSVQQNYAHFNQPLAHPLGANFAESVSFLDYRYKKWLFETEFLYAFYGKDENGNNYGGNIFESYTTRAKEYGNLIGQGLKTNLLYTKLRIAYTIVPASNLSAEAGIAIRQEKNSAGSLNTNFIFIGIKTNLPNRYSDF